MANQENFSRPTADLFSTAVVRAAQGWKKIPLRGVGNTGGPVSGRTASTTNKTAAVQAEPSQQHDQGLESILSETVTIGAGLTSIIGPSMPVQGGTVSVTSASGSSANVAGPNLVSNFKSEEELLQEKVFAARMMGAPATVASNIRLNDGASSSSVYSLDMQPKIPQQSPLPPAQQAQARLIAAALFNSIKPVLPLTNETLTPTSQTQQRLHQQEQHQRQLQQTELVLQPQQQQQKQQQVAQPALEVLKKLLKPLEQKQPQQPQQPHQVQSQVQVKLQQQQQEQHQLPGLTAALNLAGRTYPQKWSNRSQNTSTNKNDSVGGIPQCVGSSGPTADSFSTNRASAAPFRSGGIGATEPQKQGLKLLETTRTPLSVELPKAQSLDVHVLQSLKADGYIVSPNRSKIGTDISKPKSSMVDYNSTARPSKTSEGNWKRPEPVPKPPEFVSRRSNMPSGASKSTDKLQGRKTFKSQPSSHDSFAQNFLKGTDKPTSGSPSSTWHASVDAFLQSTKRGDVEMKSSGDSARQHPLLVLTTPAHVVPPVTTGLFSTAVPTEIPFLSEVETDETISSIDRRVEMLKQQKAQILQDQMEEFCKEINVYGGGTGDTGPAANQRKITATQKGPMSSEKERDGTRSQERERSRLDDRRSNKDRDRYGDRDKGRDKRRIDDRDRRTGSPPRKRPSRDEEEKKRSRSQSHHREMDKRREDYRSPPSPKRLRSSSLEKTKKDQASSKDSPKELDKRQGRYPSNDLSISSERRTSNSPERKRKKPELTTGEVFIDGRWQRSATKTSPGSMRQENPSIGSESKTKDVVMKKVKTEMSKAPDKTEIKTDTLPKKMEKDTNATPSKTTEQTEKGKNDTTKTAEKKEEVGTIPSKIVDKEREKHDLPTTTTEKMENDSSTPTKTNKGSNMPTKTTEKMDKNSATPTKTTNKGSDVPAKTTGKVKSDTPAKTIEKKEQESSTSSTAEKERKEAALLAKEKSRTDSSKSEQSKLSGVTKPDKKSNQEVVNLTLGPDTSLASKSSKMTAASRSSASPSPSQTSSSDVPLSTTKSHTAASEARDKTAESSQSTTPPTPTASLGISSTASTTSPSPQRPPAAGCKQPTRPPAVDSSSPPNKPLAVTSTSPRKGQSDCSTNHPMSVPGSVNEKIKERKRDETAVTAHGPSQTTATTKDSPLNDGIMHSSIPHQMGLLEALSTEQYVQDKVMVDWFCYVCGSICHSWRVYASHIGGRKHNSRYERLLKADQPSLEKELISKLKLLPKKGSDPIAEARMGSSLLGSSFSQVSKQNVRVSPLAGSGQTSYCSRCFRNYSCSHEEHLRSEEHKNLEGIRPRCTPCNLIFQKITQYRKHLTTPAHKKKAAAQRKSTSKETDKPSVDDNKSSTDTEKTKSPRQKSSVIGSEFITPISGFFCKLCSKFYNNEKTAREVHCATDLHITKTRQYYASRNLSPDTNLKAGQGTMQNETTTAAPPLADNDPAGGSTPSENLPTSTGIRSYGKDESAEKARVVHPIIFKDSSSVGQTSPLENMSGHTSAVGHTSSGGPSSKPGNAATVRKPTSNPESMPGRATSETCMKPEEATTTEAVPQRAEGDAFKSRRIMPLRKATPKESVPKKAEDDVGKRGFMPKERTIPKEPEGTVGKLEGVMPSGGTTPKAAEATVEKLGGVASKVGTTPMESEGETGKPGETMPRKRAIPKKAEMDVGKPRRIMPKGGATFKEAEGEAGKSGGITPNESVPVNATPSAITTAPEVATPQKPTTKKLPTTATTFKIETVATPTDTTSEVPTGPDSRLNIAMSKKSTPRIVTPKEAPPKNVTPSVSLPTEVTPEGSKSRKSEIKEVDPRVVTLQEVAPRRASPRRTRSQKGSPEGVPKESLIASPMKSRSTNASETEDSLKGSIGDGRSQRKSKEASASTETLTNEPSHTEMTPKEIKPKEITHKEHAVQVVSHKESEEANSNDITPTEIVPKETTPKFTTHMKATLSNSTTETPMSKDSTRKETTLKETTSKEITPKPTPAKDILPKEHITPKATLKESWAHDVMTKETKSADVKPKEGTQSNPSREATPKVTTHKETTPKSLEEFTSKQATSEQTIPELTTPKLTTHKIATSKKLTGKVAKPGEVVPESVHPKEIEPKQASSSPTLKAVSLVDKAAVQVPPSSESKTVTSVAVVSSPTTQKRATRSTVMQNQMSPSMTEIQSQVNKKKAFDETSQKERIASVVKPASDKTTPSGQVDTGNKAANVGTPKRVQPAPETASNIHVTVTPTKKLMVGPGSDVSAKTIKKERPSPIRKSCETAAKSRPITSALKDKSKLVAQASSAPATPNSSEHATLKAQDSAALIQKEDAISDSVEPVESSLSSFSPKIVKDVRPRSARNSLTNISPTPRSPYEPNVSIDEDQVEYIDVDELMAGDVIVLDEDSGQEMDIAHDDEEDLIIDTIGDFSGDEEVEVIDSEDEEAGFEMPDFEDMYAIDEVGGSDEEEEEEVEGHNVHQVEEWEVLSETEDD